MSRNFSFLRACTRTRAQNPTLFLCMNSGSLSPKARSPSTGVLNLTPDSNTSAEGSADRGGRGQMPSLESTSTPTSCRACSCALTGRSSTCSGSRRASRGWTCYRSSATTATSTTTWQCTSSPSSSLSHGRCCRFKTLVQIVSRM